VSECKTCEGSGRIAVGGFGCWYDDRYMYDAPGYEQCDDCEGTGKQPESDACQAA
jgi:hypothetical protein